MSARLQGLQEHKKAISKSLASARFSIIYVVLWYGYVKKARLCSISFQILYFYTIAKALFSGTHKGSMMSPQVNTILPTNKKFGVDFCTVA
jgi:hypothetical protein